MKLFYAGLIICALLAVCGTASADFTFDLGDGSWIDTSDTVDALEMWANVDGDLGDESFPLGVGESYTFHFAAMGTTETWIQDDDLVSSDIFAYLDFDMPDLTGSVDGSVVGFSGGLVQSEQGWDLVWNDPVYVDFGAGGRFSIDLSDASMRNGWWTGPDGSGESYACIFATVTLLQEPDPTKDDPVPEPTSLVLLGVGLGGFALRRRFTA